jgi:hypothetical protein
VRKIQVMSRKERTLKKNKPDKQVAEGSPSRLIVQEIGRSSKEVFPEHPECERK